uniref:Beta-defensin-like domain-containing protein n=1 Tax=Chelydra serpentina TaxID=8475 RepID=A0A8C3TAV9_CHESE
MYEYTQRTLKTLSFFTEHILSDTVICRKTQGKCSFAICPFFMKANGTCYDGKAKCCRPCL